MDHQFSLITICLLVINLQLIFASLPPELKACPQSKNIEEYNKCLTRETLKAIKLFKNGYKKFGLLPLDPLRVKEIRFQQGNGPVAMNITVNDVDLVHLSSLDVKSLECDWKIANVTVFFNKFVLKGKHTVSGKILTLPIRGSGPLLVTLENMMVNVNIYLKRIKKGGKEYFECTKIAVNIAPKHVTMRFDNLFNGDKTLGDNMNTFMNENWELIINELKPSINIAIGEALKSVSNKIFANVPIDELLV